MCQLPQYDVDTLLLLLLFLCAVLSTCVQVVCCVVDMCTGWYAVLSTCPDASVVHVSGSGQLQANPHVAGLWLSPGKPTRSAVTTMGSNYLVVGEDHML